MNPVFNRNMRYTVKQSIRTALLWAIGLLAILLVVLKLGGDFPTLASYTTPRLLLSYAVIFIVSLGMFTVFSRSFLRKYVKWAVPLALLWAAIFIFGYAYASLPEKKHLGDYITISALTFTMPYLSAAWTSSWKRGRKLWGVLQALFIFYMAVAPLVFIGYYILFGGEMDMFAMMAVMSTHTKEIKDFSETMGLGKAIGSVVLTLALLGLSFWSSFRFMRISKGEDPILRSPSRGCRIGLIFITILFVGGFYREVSHAFPISVYKAATSKGSSFEVLQKMNDNIDKNVKTMKLTETEDNMDGTHIVVIGESESRDHMKAFNPDYPYETTPWLSSVKDTPEFALNYPAYANFPNTLMSLSYALTSANQYGDHSLEHIVSIVDAARAAGYRTDWISFKNRSSLSSAGVTMIGERSDDSYWEKNPDEYAVEVMKKLPPAKKRIIFINITGSHYTYIARVPVNERDNLGIPNSDPHHDYDLTVAYDDQVVLKNIFEYARDHMNLKSMVYFSDHGENMTHYHTASPFYYDMVHIPFFVYISSDYQAAHPELMESLKAHQNRVFTNDLVFDTLSGIWKARTNFYHAEYDLSSPQYAITADQALTLDRKKKIIDDPDFKPEWK
jgi:heptose-I-phosphate ethanolaminephosphotransferase